MTLGRRVDQFPRSDVQIAPDLGSPKPPVCFRVMKQGIRFGYLRIPVPSAFFCTLQSVPWLNTAPRSITTSWFSYFGEALFLAVTTLRPPSWIHGHYF